MKIIMKHESGVNKEVKVGFSWTTLFFGCLVPLIRGDLKWAAIMFLIGLIVGSFTFGIGTVIFDVIFSFVYNKIYIKDLLLKGYNPENEDAKNILMQNNIFTV